MKNLIKRACSWENGMNQIVMALFWASAILIGSWLTRGSENADAIFLILLVGSSSVFWLGKGKNKTPKSPDCA